MSSSASWDMIVTILVSWHISGPGGQVIANHAPMFPSDPAYEQVTPSTQVLLSILWTGQWQISERNEFGNEWSPACQTAQDMMSAQLNAYQVSTTGMGAQPGLTPEQGCIISLSLSDPAQSDPIYLFYHLGVLLAANDAAHHTFPALPVASANEQALSRQLLAQSYGP